MQDKFIQERIRFRDEMDTLNRRMVMEQKRLREENLFFDKKLAILQDGFRKLEEDRQRFAQEKRRLEQNGRSQRERTELLGQGETVANVLFRSTANPLALRKRYRDLLKIFHPDNNGGDAELMQYINREFQRRKEE
ncbi:MAG: J domain-containing protein, partial [Acetatifactor sp.]|nr:J domain-containing protein [Acetatifactor sp.]